jgi:two-component system chemotaxis response regulator CheB
MPLNRIIVIGASAGGVPALCKLVATMPLDWSAAVFIALHTSPKSKLPEVLNRCIGDGSIQYLACGDEIRPGKVYVADPARHLKIKLGFVSMAKNSSAPRFRPSIDFLFLNAARAYGPRVIGVVLTGLLNDGAAGLAAIKANGGVAIVQDPRDARFPDMPFNAMKVTVPDYCLPVSEISNQLRQLVAATPLARRSKPWLKTSSG